MRNKTLVCVLLLLVIAVLAAPVSVYAATFPTTKVSHPTFYPSGCLKSLTVTVKASGSYAEAYGKIAIHSGATSYSWSNRYISSSSCSTWPDTINDPTMIGISDAEFLWTDCNEHTVIVEFTDGEIPCNTAQTYYVYLWTRAYSFGIYPDLKFNDNITIDADGTIHFGPEVLNPHGNHVSLVSGQPATCTEVGWKDYYYCSHCSTYFADDGYTVVIMDPDTWKVTAGQGKIDALGHSWSYSAEGAILTAACANDAAHEATLSLTTTAQTYSGSPCPGASADTSGWTIEGLDSPGEITYYTEDGTTKTTSENSGAIAEGEAPVNAGDYVAKISVTDARDAANTATAVAAFTVAKASQTVPESEEYYTLDYIEETLVAAPGYEVSSSNSAAESLPDDKIIPGSTYYVRKLGDENHEPSQWIAIPVKQRPAAPSGLTVTASTSIEKPNGRIAGVTEDMEYSTDNGTTWTTAKGTELTELSAGTVFIRVKATDSTPSGVIGKVTVPDAHKNENKPDAHKSEKSEKSGSKSVAHSPGTGDPFDSAAWWCLLCASLGGSVLLFRHAMKKETL